MQFIGVDVGTGSARAGLFAENGQLLRHATRDVKTRSSTESGHLEQSSADIWAAVCSAVKVSSILVLMHCVVHDA